LAHAGLKQKMQQRDRIRASRDTDEILPPWRKQCDEFLNGRQRHDGIVGRRRCLAMRD